jgi:Domain of unknown function (DUF4129)
MVIVVHRAWAATAARAPAMRAPAAHPLPDIGRRAAQRLARAELAKPAYHRQAPILARILAIIGGWLHRLYRAASHLPGGWWGLVAVAALAVIAAAVMLSRGGPAARSRRIPGLGAGSVARTAREHRETARRLAEAGDHAGAICEAVRAVAAELDERGVLPPRTGRTPDELAAEAGQALPSHAAGLREAALLFDEIRYGQRGGTPAGYEGIRVLDLRIRTTTARAGLVFPRRSAPMLGGDPR